MKSPTRFQVGACISFKKLNIISFSLFLTASLLLSHAPALKAALQTKDEMPELLGIEEWKSAYGPLRKKNLQGGVVLVHFSSFTDLRSLYKSDTLINWQSKYFAYGFRIIHILTPDFEFENQITLPTHLTQKKQVNYPIALDFKKTQWQSYKNPEKPADFLIDSRGRIRFKVSFNENFETEEKKIQILIKEIDPAFEMELEKYQAQRIPEVQNYPLGYRKNMSLGNTEKPRSETRQKFKLPDGELNENLIYLSGYWKLRGEYAETAEGGAELRLIWDGSPLFILAGIDRESPTPMEVKIDGAVEIPKKINGSDLIKQGEGYYIFLQKTKIFEVSRRFPAGKHILLLRFPEAGAKIYQVSHPLKKNSSN